jgi:hypothetical protein
MLRDVLATIASASRRGGALSPELQAAYDACHD